MSKEKVPSRFVGLHSHSGFSTFDGLGYPPEHIDSVIENGMDAWALTDHGHMNGFCHAYLHAEKIKKAGTNFKLIPGCEMYVHPNLQIWELDYEIRKAEKREDTSLLEVLYAQRNELEAPVALLSPQIDLALDIQEDDAGGVTIEDEDATKSQKFFDPLKRRHHLVVLPKSSVGLQRLFGLVSRGYLEGFYRFPRVDYLMLKEAAEGGHLMALSACIGGPLAREVFINLQHVEFDDMKPELLDDPALMEKILSTMIPVYRDLVNSVGKENFYIELQFNKLNAQHTVNRALLELARRENAMNQLVVTCDSHYPKSDQWRERELYKKLGWLNHKQFDPDQLPKSKDDLKCELFPKNAEQIWESYHETTTNYGFYDDDVICDAIERTHDIAHNIIGEIHADTTPKLPNWVVPEGTTAKKALESLCNEGMISRKLNEKPEYVARLERELKVIADRNFEQYFLTMHQLIGIAHKNMLVAPGRGSGAGSLVNYCLRITDVDPIKYDLLFERFLSKYRKEVPDIDTDISDRDKLLKLLEKEFDDNCVIPISNYNTFALKSLIKDVSKFYGVPFEESNIATKTVEREVRNATTKHGEDKNLFVLTYDDAMEHSESFRTFIEKYPEVGEPIKVLFKQNKSLGRHAGGVIICDDVPSRMPLILAKGKPQTPWVEGVNFKHLEEFGWIKFDLLGLETLRVIERTIELILQRHNGIKNPKFHHIKKWYDENLAPDVVDFDDQHVYKQIYHEGRFAGIFQLTSKGAQKLFMQAKPTGIIDIATLTSIYRPGPLAANVHKLYLNHSNEDPFKWPHPLVNETLYNTRGMIIFQEQVMNLAHKVAGFPLEECDKVRKAIMKRSISGGDAAKKKADEMRFAFVDGSVENGLTKETANDLYDKILYWSGYGFNKSHAVSYAMVSFFCAWLMTYYEKEWLCAYLEVMSTNDKKKSRAFNEVRKLGYKIDPIDINYAEKSWTILDGKRFMPSFLSCKGIGDAAIDEIVANRPYKDINDLLWDDEGKWKHSKFNKRTMQSLIKIKAFGSMDLVGPNNTFESYKQMDEVVINHNADLKKKLKKEPLMGQRLFKEHLLATEGIGEWSKVEYAENLVSQLGSCNASALASPKLLSKMNEMNLSPVDDHNGEDIYWFIVTDQVAKKTKNGKPYLLLTVAGEAGTTEKMFMWGWKRPFAIPKYSMCIAKVDKSDFGLSTRQWDIKVLS